MQLRPRCRPSFADHELAIRFQLLVAPENSREELVGSVGGRHGARLVIGAATRRGRVVVKGVAISHEVDFAVVIGMPGNDRPEEPQSLHPPRRELHEPERHERLSSARLNRCDVDALCHVLPPARAECHRTGAVSTHVASSLERTPRPKKAGLRGQPRTSLQPRSLALRAARTAPSADSLAQRGPADSNYNRPLRFTPQAT